MTLLYFQGPVSGNPQLVNWKNVYLVVERPIVVYSLLKTVDFKCNLLIFAFPKAQLQNQNTFFFKIAQCFYSFVLDLQFDAITFREMVIRSNRIWQTHLQIIANNVKNLPNYWIQVVLIQRSKP